MFNVYTLKGQEQVKNSDPHDLNDEDDECASQGHAKESKDDPQALKIQFRVLVFRRLDHGVGPLLTYFVDDATLDKSGQDIIEGQFQMVGFGKPNSSSEGASTLRDDVVRIDVAV